MASTPEQNQEEEEAHVVVEDSFNENSSSSCGITLTIPPAPSNASSSSSSSIEAMLSSWATTVERVLVMLDDAKKRSTTTKSSNTSNSSSCITKDGDGLLAKAEAGKQEETSSSDPSLEFFDTVASELRALQDKITQEKDNTEEEGIISKLLAQNQQQGKQIQQLLILAVEAHQQVAATTTAATTTTTAAVPSSSQRGSVVSSSTMGGGGVVAGVGFLRSSISPSGSTADLLNLSTETGEDEESSTGGSSSRKRKGKSNKSVKFTPEILAKEAQKESVLGKKTAAAAAAALKSKKGAPLRWEMEEDEEKRQQQLPKKDAAPPPPTSSSNNSGSGDNEDSSNISNIIRVTPIQKKWLNDTFRDESLKAAISTSMKTALAPTTTNKELGTSSSTTEQPQGSTTTTMRPFHFPHDAQLRRISGQETFLDPFRYEEHPDRARQAFVDYACSLFSLFFVFSNSASSSSASLKDPAPQTLKRFFQRLYDYCHDLPTRRNICGTLRFVSVTLCQAWSRAPDFFSTITVRELLATLTAAVIVNIGKGANSHLAGNVFPFRELFLGSSSSGNAATMMNTTVTGGSGGSSDSRTMDGNRRKASATSGATTTSSHHHHHGASANAAAAAGGGNSNSAAAVIESFTRENYATFLGLTLILSGGNAAASFSSSSDHHHDNPDAENDEENTNNNDTSYGDDCNFFKLVDPSIFSTPSNLYCFERFILSLCQGSHPSQYASLFRSISTLTSTKTILEADQLRCQFLRGVIHVGVNGYHCFLTSKEYCKSVGYWCLFHSVSYHPGSGSSSGGSSSTVKDSITTGKKRSSSAVGGADDASSVIAPPCAADCQQALIHYVIKPMLSLLETKFFGEAVVMNELGGGGGGDDGGGAFNSSASASFAGGLLGLPLILPLDWIQLLDANYYATDMLIRYASPSDIPTRIKGSGGGGGGSKSQNHLLPSSFSSNSLNPAPIIKVLSQDWTSIETDRQALGKARSQHRHEVRQQFALLFSNADGGEGETGAASSTPPPLAISQRYFILLRLLLPEVLRIFQTPTPHRRAEEKLIDQFTCHWLSYLIQLQSQLVDDDDDDLDGDEDSGGEEDGGDTDGVVENEGGEKEKEVTTGEQQGDGAELTKSSSPEQADSGGATGKEPEEELVKEEVAGEPNKKLKRRRASKTPSEEAGGGAAAAQQPREILKPFVLHPADPSTLWHSTEELELYFFGSTKSSTTATSTGGGGEASGSSHSSHHHHKRGHQQQHLRTKGAATSSSASPTGGSGHVTSMTSLRDYERRRLDWFNIMASTPPPHPTPGALNRYQLDPVVLSLTQMWAGLLQQKMLMMKELGIHQQQHSHSHSSGGELVLHQGGGGGGALGSSLGGGGAFGAHQTSRVLHRFREFDLRLKKDQAASTAWERSKSELFRM